MVNVTWLKRIMWMGPCLLSTYVSTEVSLSWLTGRNGSWRDMVLTLVSKPGTSKISWVALPIWAPWQFPRNFHWLGFLCPFSSPAARVDELWAAFHSRSGRNYGNAHPSLLPSSSGAALQTRTKFRPLLGPWFFCLISGLNKSIWALRVTFQLQTQHRPPCFKP